MSGDPAKISEYRFICDNVFASSRLLKFYDASTRKINALVRFFISFRERFGTIKKKYWLQKEVFTLFNLFILIVEEN
jgi:hypothetical protein